MRRALAILLLSAINVLLIAPSASKRGEAQIPPCCRAHGKHKCAMAAALSAVHGSGTAIANVSEKCPFGSGVGSLGAGSSPFILYCSQHLSGQDLSSVITKRDPQSRSRVVLHSAPPKRGPPSLLF